MDAKELKSRLSDNNIKYILQTLGGIIYEETDDYITLNTICHGGNSPNKLSYSKEFKTFYCFTSCGLTDILAIVSEVKELNLSQSITYICTLLGISDIKYGFNDDRIKVISDWSFINGYKRKYERLNKIPKEFIILNKRLLNMFQPIYTDEWRNENISEEIMQEYNILYSTYRQSIIIPHFDINNELIGIRQRATLDFDIDTYGKYTPFIMCGDMYNHSLGNNLYGVNMNQECIKRIKKVMLVESEKSVLQSASFFGVENNFTVALCGSVGISNTQRNMLLSLDVNEVIIGFDRQYKEVNDDEYKEWQLHIREKIINPLSPYFKVNVLWDTEGLLGYKQSPTDVSKEVLLKLMKNKIYIDS